MEVWQVCVCVLRDPCYLLYSSFCLGLLLIIKVKSAPLGIYIKPLVMPLNNGLNFSKERYLLIYLGRFPKFTLESTIVKTTDMCLFSFDFLFMFYPININSHLFNHKEKWNSHLKRIDKRVDKSETQKCMCHVFSYLCILNFV